MDRIKLFIVGLCYLGLVLWVMVRMVEGGGLYFLGLAGAVLCGVGWVFLARQGWWMLAFASGYLGGFIWLGYKLYPQELGMALSLAALLPLLAMKALPRFPNRPKLDVSFLVLMLYLLAHFGISYYAEVQTGATGKGTIVRQYFSAFWPVLFAALFWRYGDLRRFKTALVLATTICGMRLTLGLIALYIPDWFYYIPGVNFVFWSGEADLRASGIMFMGLMVLWFYRVHRPVGRGLILLLYGAGMFLVILGLSRVQTLVALAIPLIWALAQRRWLVLFTAFIGIAVFIIMLNMNTGVFERLPEGTRRSLSGLVVLRYVPEHQVTFGSDSWHYYLLRAGKERWLQSYGTFLCGNKLHAYSVVNMPLSTSAEDSADFAAKLTAYENAFFTVTASLGLVGLLLFIRVLYWLYRPFFGEVVRRGLRGPDGALLYLACQTFILYVAFAWISGGWPVEPILLGTLAAAGYYDRSRGTDGSVSKDGCPGGSLISDSAARQQTKDGTYRRTESGGPPARHTLPGNIDRNRDDSCG